MDTIEITVLDSLAQIPAAEWDACANPGAAPRPTDPFTTHRFLYALERSGSVGPGTGWQPQYLVARQGGQLIGTAPLYVKSHSQGEYIFDFNWAQAYENAGGQYYPKLQIAVPFTPATGRRFLAHPKHGDTAQAALTQAAVELAARHDCSSLHITFCTAQEAEKGAQMGLLPRASQQFHWLNRDYPDFEAFLQTLSSRKRKAIRKERRTAQTFGGTIEALTGAQIQPHHWDAFWQFYQDTGARKWGQPYLTRAFFDLAQDTLRDDMLLVLAREGDTYIAGAMNMIGADTLYGRYWGCTRHHPCLHFEMCYYQAIDYAIAHNLSRVEAGAQGEHKLARGYLPTQTHSLHWIADPGLRAAISEYLTAESQAISEDMEILSAYAPFKSHE
jgi:predicted N-acyltransferase